MHKIPAVTTTLLSLAAPAALAHSGDHSGSLLAVFAHLWSHADHWLPALVALAAVGLGAVLLRLRPGRRHPDGLSREE